MKRPIKQPFKECSQSQKKQEHVRIGEHPLPLSWEPLFMKKLWSHKKNAVCVVLWLVNGENYFTKSHRHRSETSRQLLKDTESSIWLFLGQKCESESTLSSVDWLPQTLAHAGICSCKAVAGFRQLTFPKNALVFQLDLHSSKCIIITPFTLPRSCVSD